MGPDFQGCVCPTREARRNWGYNGNSCCCPCRTSITSFFFFSSLAFSVLPQHHTIVKILEITKTTAESKLTDISQMTKITQITQITKKTDISKKTKITKLTIITCTTQITHVSIA